MYRKLLMVTIKYVDISYDDLEQTFSIVDPFVLLNKLNYFRFTVKLLNLFVIIILLLKIICRRRQYVTYLWHF